MNEIQEQSPIDVAVERVRRVYGSWRRDTPVSRMRADWDDLFYADTLPVQTEMVSADGVDAVWITPAAARAQNILVYFHGGGFKLGSVRSHHDLMARIAMAANCRVLGVNYRLAPEHLFPAAMEDALAVYQWLLDSGVAAQNIALAGDSAGGGIVASTLLALKAKRKPLPAAAVMLSAWTDLTASAESYTTRADADPIHQRALILNTAKNYLGADFFESGGDPRDPMISPLFGDLAGLPPLLLQVGDRETGLDDSRHFAAKAQAAGVAVELQVFDGMIHVFQQFPDLLPEARAAIETIGSFLQSAWQQAQR